MYLLTMLKLRAAIVFGKGHASTIYFLQEVQFKKNPKIFELGDKFRVVDKPEYGWGWESN